MHKTPIYLFLLLLIATKIEAQTKKEQALSDINQVISNLYKVISGPAGDRDWQFFQTLYHEKATMGSIQTDQQGNQNFASFTPEEYIERNAPFFQENEFYEDEMKREIHVFGDIAQVRTSYQIKLEKEGKVQLQGLNYLQLVKNKGKWQITNIIWEPETTSNRLPPVWKGVGNQIQLHNIFGDHMVIQREKPIHIKGWSAPGSTIKAAMGGQSGSAITSNDGTFVITLQPMPAGGPYQLRVTGPGNPVIISDVYIGEVWICGGQSNMQWSVANANNPEIEIKNANYPKIRMLTIPRMLSSERKENLPDLDWQICSPSTISDFSAVGYFFARKLQKELNVPIGLVDNSWGGTNIEGWMSEEAFSNLPSYHSSIKEYKNKYKDTNNKYKTIADWQDAMIKSDLGMKEKWYNPEVPKNQWEDYKISGLWEDKGYPSYDGIAWVSCKFNYVANDVDSVRFQLGKIDDTDSTYLNGKLIGTTYNAYNKMRSYTIPASMLKKENELTIKIEDYQGGGGVSSIEDSIYLQSGHYKIPLAEKNWKIKLGTPDFPPAPANLNSNSYPTNRYNTMVHPLTFYPVRGEIYYQGESNAYMGRKYAPLFKNMIQDYRRKWNQDDFVFLFVQLANFRKQYDHPVDEDWAHLRLAQADALSLPLTGMTTAIDIGNADDIHPRDKQTVGSRLADNALGGAYGYDIVHQGPVVDRLLSDGKDILLQYKNIGDGLWSKHGRKQLRAFAYTTDGQQWKWANAQLDGKNRVRISSPKGQTIIGIRYAHANNPGELDLYNSNGLPAIPGQWIMK